MQEARKTAKQRRRRAGVRSPSAIDKAIGVNIRVRRLLLGMSQGALGEAVGVTFQQVQKYEKGVNRIAAGTLFEIARALDMPVGDLFPTA